MIPEDLELCSRLGLTPDELEEARRLGMTPTARALTKRMGIAPDRYIANKRTAPATDVQHLEQARLLRGMADAEPSGSAARQRLEELANQSLKGQR